MLTVLLRRNNTNPIHDQHKKGGPTAPYEQLIHLLLLVLTIGHGFIILACSIQEQFLIFKHERLGKCLVWE